MFVMEKPKNYQSLINLNSLNRNNLHANSLFEKKFLQKIKK